jgi:tetratricopeptide (TPR) repeat protein
MAALVLLALLVFRPGGAALPRDPAQAVIELQKRIRQSPEIEENYTALGNLLLHTQNFREAALVLEHARQKFPQSAQAALSLGVAYYGLRRFEEAVVQFLEAGRLDGDAEQPIIFLSRMAESWGSRKEEVIALFAAFLKRHPRSALAHLALGRATADVTLLRKAVKLNPTSAEAYIELGSVLQAERKYAEAIHTLRRAAALAPKNPIPPYRLAQLYARIGDQARAKAARALHEKLAAAEQAELDRRQAEAKHLNLRVAP